MTIRGETPRDWRAIREVNDLAFGRADEGMLIERLRGNAEFIPELSLVAEVDESVIGHILFFPVKIIDGSAMHPSLALAPMAVVPNFQRRRIGGKLIRKGLERAKELGFQSVIVLGHPEYYPKFGFKPANRWSIKTRYHVPDEAFMAVEVVTNGLKAVSGMVQYPPEFDQMTD